MKANWLGSIVAFLALVLGLPALGRAATLQAQVDEVRSGDRIVVSNTKRPLLIKLKAIAPPATGQPFSDEAREHLSALILNKTVSVEYSQLAEGWLVARVICNGVDVGAQMIRDGVAWYDRSNEHSLSESDRTVYAESEQAARNERRGLWGQQDPVSPWQFREPARASVNPDPILPITKPRAPRVNRSGLSNHDLMGSYLGPGSIAGQPTVRQLFVDGTPGRWRRFESAAKDFSILAPGDGTEAVYSVLDDHGKAVELRYIMGVSDQALFILLSTKGPDNNANDASVAAEAVKGLLMGINGRRRPEQGPGIEAIPGRVVKQGGYTGRQYSLSGGPGLGIVRVLSKRIGDQRKLFVLCVLNGPSGESQGTEFFNSLRINEQ